MNKKILLSTAAAVVLAVGFTGCGSDDAAASSSSGNTAIIPADGYIYGSTVSCANGTATIGDDNLTVTVNSSNPGLCTVTGGAHLIGGQYIANNAVLKVNVPADSNATVYATPITTMVAASGDANATLRLLGVNPAGKTQDKINALIAADPTNLPADYPNNARAKVVQIYNVINQLTNAKASSTAIDAVLKELADDATNVDTSDLNTTALENALTNNGISASVAAAIKSTADTITSKLGSLDKDEAEASADAVLKVLESVKTQVADGNITIDINASVDTAISDIQAALEVVYLGGINNDNNDTNGTYRLASDGNATDVDANLTFTDAQGLPTLAFNLADQNVTDGNFTADISLLFQNEGNANFSMKSVLKDIAVVGTEGTYTFTLANNTNITVAGTNYTGVDFTSGTYDADSNVTLGEDPHTSEMNLIVGYGTDGKAIDTNATTGYTKFDLDMVSLWTEHKLGVDDDNETVLSNYGVNGNWSTKLLINLKDASGTVKLYKAQGDGKLSQAAQDSINVDGTTQTGAIIFNGRIVEVE